MAAATGDLVRVGGALAIGTAIVATLRSRAIAARVLTWFSFVVSHFVLLR